MSREFQSRPVTSFERALHLIEHVAQHHSAKFIRNSLKKIKLNYTIYHWLKLLLHSDFDLWLIGVFFAFIVFKIIILTLKIQLKLTHAAIILLKKLINYFKTIRIISKKGINYNLEK